MLMLKTTVFNSALTVLNSCPSAHPSDLSLIYLRGIWKNFVLSTEFFMLVSCNLRKLSLRLRNIRPNND